MVGHTIGGQIKGHALGHGQDVVGEGEVGLRGAIAQAVAVTLDLVQAAALGIDQGDIGAGEGQGLAAGVDQADGGVEAVVGAGKVGGGIVMILTQR